MTIKSALSVVALAAGLVAVPSFAQDRMIGTFSVPAAEVRAVQARCDDLKLNADTESLVSESDSETDNEDDAEDDANTETEVAGDAGVSSEPALTDSPTATTVDLAAITLEDCEAGGWFEAM